MLATLDKGEQLSVRQHTLIRLALTNVTQALHDVANFVYLAAGSTVAAAEAIQRLPALTCARARSTSRRRLRWSRRSVAGLLSLAEGMRWQSSTSSRSNRLAGDALRRDVAGRAPVSRPPP